MCQGINDCGTKDQGQKFWTQALRFKLLWFPKDIHTNNLLCAMVAFMTPYT